MIQQTAKEFLLDNLSNLAGLFPVIHIRYENRNNKHIVEVIPLSVYESDEDYLKAEMYIEKHFEVLFPEEEIVFISENSLTQIKYVDYEFGKDLISMDIGIETPD